MHTLSPCKSPISILFKVPLAYCVPICQQIHTGTRRSLQAKREHSNLGVRTVPPQFGKSKKANFILEYVCSFTALIQHSNFQRKLCMCLWQHILNVFSRFCYFLQDFAKFCKFLQDTVRLCLTLKDCQTLKDLRLKTA